MPVVADFKYLGSQLCRTSTDTLDVSSRIESAAKAFGALRKCLFASNNISAAAKRAVYVSVILAILLYGCECWSLTEKLVSRLRVFHNQCVRAELGNTPGATGFRTRLFASACTSILLSSTSTVDNFAGSETLRGWICPDCRVQIVERLGTDEPDGLPDQLSYSIELAALAFSKVMRTTSTRTDTDTSCLLGFAVLVALATVRVREKASCNSATERVAASARKNYLQRALAGAKIFTRIWAKQHDRIMGMQGSTRPYLVWSSRACLGPACPHATECRFTECRFVVKIRRWHDGRRRQELKHRERSHWAGACVMDGGAAEGSGPYTV